MTQIPHIGVTCCDRNPRPREGDSQMTSSTTPKRTRTARLGLRLLAGALITCALGAPRSAQATIVTLDASQDAWMDQLLANQNVNHGSDTLLNVQGGNTTQVKRRTLVQFDLSSI